MLLQCLADLAGWHKNHDLAPARHSKPAKPGDHAWAFVDWHASSKKRDVGAVDPTHEYFRVGNPKRLQDAFLHLLSGGCRERQNRRRTQDLTNFLETSILGPKIPSPLVNAMGLVYHQKRGANRPQLLLLLDALNKEPLGRD